ncbi:ATP-binding protein [Novosphingobium sediminicola]|uniref:histidine kinase n=1 Tax=Novosphingobium sediminicola TaxID=563162 RepID=A0A7W6CG32_9SPHN|nr:ATP-binding protein [Novosphingobium sediminicola]MBB3954780.1 two-component system sensor histidine kinase RegB [Novosphingobium sediminicola]
MATQPAPAHSSPGADYDIAPASYGNMGLLVQLRWIAVLGQLVTIWVAWRVLGVGLPMAELVAVPALLALMNIGTWAYGRQRAGYSYLELLGALMLDVEALSWQLYFTGGATNPFIFLFLVQIMLGAILLPARWSWIVALVACCDVAFLTFDFRPLDLPPAYVGEHFRLYLLGSLACFVLIAALLVYFVVRMDRNQRASSAALAALRQQAAEENHIIRLGLLASGAAHELGTPMASMSVILGDWAREKTIAGDPDLAADVADMQAELKRCKTILSGILMAAGEVRGENPSVTTARGFLCQIVEDWRARSPGPITLDDRLGEDVPIIADPALRQVIGNVVDNALEVSPEGIAIATAREGDIWQIAVRDFGPGFAPDMIDQVGRPYRSTKGRDGGGLGLFLVVNVLRQLGGRIEVSNTEEGGALVVLSIPLSALAFTGKGAS